MNFLKRKYKLIIGILLIAVIIIFLSVRQTYQVKLETVLWKVKSIDTMKYSRDVAREKLNDPSFDKVIDKQISDIASTGANYVAIATPYDEEFYPILARWVNSARRHNLHVWFRGNMSGWEGWFEYPKIDRATHTKQIENFILSHKDLFQDEDIFSTCPECENGGPGDPRFTRDIEAYRDFLINEHKVADKAFASINKKVATNYDSMNYDVANLIMDKKTTAALGGVVVIDHYIGDADRYVSDIEKLVKQSGGKIVIGEFGAPIPDLNGKMTEQEQAEWISRVLEHFSNSEHVIGVNYWTSVGSSTELWSNEGKPRQVVSVIRQFYQFKPAYGMVQDDTGVPIANVAIKKTRGEETLYGRNDGTFILTYLNEPTYFEFRKEGYTSQRMLFANQGGPYIITLKKENPSLMHRIKSVFK